MRLALLLLLSVILVVACCTDSNAHDEFEWINKGKYKNNRGEHCCGERDCEVIPDSDVREEADYYVYLPTQERISKRDTLMSENDRYVRCFYHLQGIKMTRCFFYPFKGM